MRRAATTRPVRNLILMATPVDFDEMGAMVALLREGRLSADELIDDTGNVPADALYSGFYMQAPTVEVAQKATLLENLWNDEFVEGFQAMGQWSRDHVPFPGAAFRQLVDELVRKNVLMTGSIRLGDRKVELANARGNVLNAMAERDNVVPPAAVEPVMELVGDPARREEMRLTGGHVTFGTGRQRREGHPSRRLTRLDHRAQRRASSPWSGDGVPTDRTRRRAGADALLRPHPRRRPDVPQGGRERPGVVERVGASPARRA